MGIWVIGWGVFSALGAGPSGILPWNRPDPAEVLPVHRIAPEYRGDVEQVIRNNHFHHRGEPETFPGDPRIYLSLLNDPALTLALWKDLGDSKAQLATVAPGRFQGTDGNGTSAIWDYVLTSPELHVMLCRIDYRSPRSSARLQGRIVLIVRTEYFKEPSGAPWIRHQIEAFVKVDSRGWRTVAKTVRPLIERLLENQIQEAGWFVSLMARLVQTHPDWADQVAGSRGAVLPESRDRFRSLLQAHRGSGASTGRPALAEAGYDDPERPRAR